MDHKKHFNSFHLHVPKYEPPLSAGLIGFHLTIMDMSLSNIAAKKKSKTNMFRYMVKKKYAFSQAEYRK